MKLRFEIRMAQLGRRDVDGNRGWAATRPAIHSRQSSAACATTQSPTGTIRPTDSSSGRNAAGDTSPSSGLRQRSSASAPSIRRGDDVHLGLVMQFELAPLERKAQAVLQRQPSHVLGTRRGTVLHHQFARCAGMPQRGLGVLHQRHRIRDRASGDSAKPERIATGIDRPSISERFAEQLPGLLLADDLRIASARIHALPSGAISAKVPPPKCAIWSVCGHDSLQAIRHMLQQQVAGAPPEGVIDDAEPFDVEHDDRMVQRSARADSATMRCTRSQNSGRLASPVCGSKWDRKRARLSRCRYCRPNDRLPATSRSMASSSCRDHTRIAGRQQQHADGRAIHQPAAAPRPSACPP